MRRLAVLWGALAVVTVADLLSTYFLLQAGGFERNPMMAYVLTYGWGAVALAKAAFLAVAFVVLRACERCQIMRLAVAVMGPMAALTGAVAANNTVLWLT